MIGPTGNHTNKGRRESLTSPAYYSMLDIFNRKKLAAVTEERDYWQDQVSHSDRYAEQMADQNIMLADQNVTLSEKVLALSAELTAIKEKQRENSRKGALAANAKRRAAKEGV